MMKEPFTDEERRLSDGTSVFKIVCSFGLQTGDADARLSVSGDRLSTELEGDTANNNPTL